MENDGDDADGLMLGPESPLLVCVQGLTLNSLELLM
jgi:hypothetical protein